MSQVGRQGLGFVLVGKGLRVDRFDSGRERGTGIRTSGMGIRSIGMGRSWVLGTGSITGAGLLCDSDCRREEKGREKF